MAARGETRAQVLATARILFSRQGYHATGINQVLAEADAPKGSLYFHFPGGKEELAAEAVGLGANELGQVIDAVIEDSPDPAAAIRTMAELLASRLEASDFLDGCPIATVALDASSDSAAVRDACCAGYDQWLTSIANYLARFGMSVDTASELALVALSSLEGALLLARTQRDATPVRRVADRVATLVSMELTQ
ncbi:TetR/AcrR family transcriptional regulator [Rhodococcus oryzae]|uniref:TetR/AcrR family transcriptional regulator n=1 Tax=Rhodococcus oryzae TaxID=2571143 RepID=UPI0037904854